MKKLYLLILAGFIFGLAPAQQQLLITETFDNPGGNSFIFDSLGPTGVNSGTNSWIVNNQYNGQPTYPNTATQDSTFSGTINGAPRSKYLHIHDETTSSVSNANWNPANESDRFCYVGNSFCTLGLTDVIFTFFWLCDGNDDSYGEVYYRSGGGPWIKTGQPKYNNQHIWKYEIIQDPGFNNKPNIQVGFRWVNPSAGTTNTSFGIDDIIAVGNFNPRDSASGVKLSTFVYNTQICQGEQVTVNFSLNRPLCDGTYQLQMSGANGNFSSPYNLGILNLGPTFTSGNFTSLGTPGNALGNCYKVRIVRTSPAPVVISDTSACFAVVACPNQIFNLDAPVMYDADTTCVLSVIDVKFNSKGVFQNGNTYIAELSDANGSFVDSFYLGSLPVRDSFPAIPPGSISGLIPESVPAGCGYYIRVRSTRPATLSAPFGPFCLAHCDELTNNHEDLNFCVQSGPYPSCDSLVIKKNYWDNQAQYDTCNDWAIELRSMKDFSLVDIGSLAVYHDNKGGTFQLCMAPTKAQLPVAPGAYYMRMRSNCSSQPWNQTGSVIRIVIGAPDAIPPRIFSDDSVFCRGEVVGLSVSPFFSPPSEYEWSSNLLNNGIAFKWPYNPLYINLSPNTLLGDYIFYVREINYGCNGASSAPARITIIGKPDVEIAGPKTVCIGDTAKYNVTYLKETYYEWNAPPGITVLDRGNSEVTLVFDSIGTFTFTNFTLNSCGSDNGSYTVTVTPAYFLVDAGPDLEVCTGDTVNLHVETSTLNETFISQQTGTLQDKPGGMFSIKAHDDVTIDSFAVRLLTTNGKAFGAEIYGKEGTYLSYEQDANAWTMLTLNYNLKAASGGFTNISAPVSIPIPKDSTYSFYVTTINSPLVPVAYGKGVGNQGSVYNSDGIIDFIQGTVNDYSFGSYVPIVGYVMNIKIYYSSKGGFIYSWTTGDSTSTFSFVPTQSGPVQVLVSDKGLCSNKDEVTILLKPAPEVNAGPDTLICPQVPYVMPATTTGTTVEWQPADGLTPSNTTLNPTVTISQNQQYVLIATDPSSECKSRDVVNISVSPLSVNAGPDTTVCYEQLYVIPATASAYRSLVWSPADGLSSIDSLNPTFNPNEGGGLYTITIIDTMGCSLSSSVTLTSGNCPSYIMAPQAFTPNGDNTNDFFTVFGKNISSYEIRIYNRWGELVYSAGNKDDLNQLDKGWDGTYKGKPQDSGTFVYYIDAKDLDGKKVSSKGNLTLIR